jgi:hypothetical protein
MFIKSAEIIGAVITSLAFYRRKSHERLPCGCQRVWQPRLGDPYKNQWVAGVGAQTPIVPPSLAFWRGHPGRDLLGMADGADHDGIWLRQRAADR